MKGFMKVCTKKKHIIQESPILALGHQFVLNPANDLFDVVLNDSVSKVCFIKTDTLYCIYTV